MNRVGGTDIVATIEAAVANLTGAAEQLRMAERFRERTTVAKLAPWVREARAGASVMYGIGDVATAACNPVVRKQVMEWQERGFVHLVQARRAGAVAGAAFEYRMQRSSRPWPKGAL